MITSAKTNGFSLIEVIVSMILLSLLAVGVVSTTAYGKNSRIQATEKLMAVTLLEKEMNQLRQAGAKNLGLGTTQRQTKKNEDGLDGNLITQIAADAAHPEDKYVRLRMEWRNGTYIESLAGFLYGE